MKTRLAFLAGVLLFTVIVQDYIYAQENNKEFEYILQIDNDPLTRIERRALKKAKNHQEYDVVVKKISANLSLLDKEGYMIFYYYKENNDLKTEWVQIPDSTMYDQFQYNWEPGLFKWKFVNSKTGKSTLTMASKLE